MKHNTTTLVLALLIMALFSSVWATEITIPALGGEDTTTNLPIMSWDHYSYSQQIYTAAEIGSAMEITKIRFYWVSGDTSNSEDWTIYMGHTAKVGFAPSKDWVTVSEMQLIFEGVLALPAVEGWWEITLNIPFDYNGSDNLLIAIDENTPDSSFPMGMSEWRSFGTDDAGGGKGHDTYTYSIYYANDDDGLNTNNPDPADPPTDDNTHLTNVRNQIVLVGTVDDTLPVQLSSFTAVITGQNYVKLDWITQTESSMCGYYVYRSESNVLETASQVSLLIPATNTSSEHRYSHLDTEVHEGTWYYWLESVGYAGESDYYGCILVNIESGDEDISPDLSLVTSINKVFPNPFNPVTTISYDLKKAETVKISIYNVKGEKVKELLSEDKQPGSYRLVWNGDDALGRALASGTYIIKLSAGDTHCSKRAVLMK